MSAVQLRGTTGRVEVLSTDNPGLWPSFRSNFVRTLGSVWGVAIPAAIFNNHVDTMIANGAVSSPVAVDLLRGGGAYQLASAALSRRFPPVVQDEIRNVYQRAIQRVLCAAIAFTGFAWFICWFEKDIPLRTELVTDHGLKEDEGS